ncbi:hypothetical protein ABKN59_006111 [Abortiporus biennis]
MGALTYAPRFNAVEKTRVGYGCSFVNLNIVDLVLDRYSSIVYIFHFMEKYKHYCEKHDRWCLSNSPVGPVTCGINLREAHWARYISVEHGIVYEYNNADGTFYYHYEGENGIHDSGQGWGLYYPGPVPFHDRSGRRPFEVIMLPAVLAVLGFRQRESPGGDETRRSRYQD